MSCILSEGHHFCCRFRLKWQQKKRSAQGFKMGFKKLKGSYTQKIYVQNSYFKIYKYFHVILLNKYNVK